MTPFLTEVTTSLVCVVSMAEALLSRVCCDGDRDSDRVRREAGGRVAEMAWYEAGASIGVLRNQRQHRPKRISFAVRALAAGLVLCSLAASACTAAPTAGGARRRAAARAPPARPPARPPRRHAGPPPRRGGAAWGGPAAARGAGGNPQAPPAGRR